MKPQANQRTVYAFPEGRYTDLVRRGRGKEHPPINAEELAEAIFSRLLRAIQQDCWALYLDLGGVEYMSLRYAKWLVRRVIKQATTDDEHSRVRIILINTNELVREEIEGALNLTNFVTFIEDVPGEPSILGDVDDMFRLSFETVRRTGPMNAQELAQSLQIPRPTAANYLERLRLLGLVSRREYRGRRGRGYRYGFMPVGLSGTQQAQ